MLYGIVANFGHENETDEKTKEISIQVSCDSR